MREPVGGSGGGDGFEVDPASLKGVAGKAGRAYDDFQAVVTDFRTTGGYDGGLFGDVRSAWSGFDTAWSLEVTTTSAALAELVQKLSTTADAYTNGDYAAEKAIRRAFGG